MQAPDRIFRSGQRVLHDFRDCSLISACDQIRGAVEIYLKTVCASGLDWGIRG